MAGVKGRSGGPRPNSGGARPGAGRKPKNPASDSAKAKKRAPNSANDSPPPAEGKGAEEPPVRKDPLAFLEDVVNDPGAPLKDRIRAAVAAAQYRHTKKGDGGLKDEAAEKAKKAAGGKFKAAPAPLKLVRPS